MLLAGLNHMGVLTNDTNRLHTFYSKVFDPTVVHDFRDGGMRLSLVDLEPATQLNVLEIEGNTEADSQESFDEIR